MVSGRVAELDFSKIRIISGRTAGVLGTGSPGRVFRDSEFIAVVQPQEVFI